MSKKGKTPTGVNSPVVTGPPPRTATGNGSASGISKSGTGYGGPYGSYSGYSGGYYTAPKCFHDGESTLFKIKELSIHGSRISAMGVDVPGVILDCTNSEKDYEGLSFSDPAYEGLLAYVAVPEIIRIDWPDGGVPPVLPEFWRALIDAVYERSYHLTVCCMGAHGRTGTALASIAMLWLDMPADKAVQFIRKEHCDRAVETSAQVAYLKEVEQWGFDNKFISKRSKSKITGSYQATTSSYHATTSSAARSSKEKSGSKEIFGFAPRVDTATGKKVLRKGVDVVPFHPSEIDKDAAITMGYVIQPEPTLPDGFCFRDPTGHLSIYTYETADEAWEAAVEDAQAEVEALNSGK